MSILNKLFGKTATNTNIAVAEPEETKAVLTKTITLDKVIDKDFVKYFKDYLKELANDQRIAKRDRKDEKHPCPEKRKYNPLEARDLVESNRSRLRAFYAYYNLVRKHRDFDWSRFEISVYSDGDYDMDMENYKDFGPIIDSIDSGIGIWWSSVRVFLPLCLEYVKTSKRW